MCPFLPSSSALAPTLCAPPAQQCTAGSLLRRPRRVVGSYWSSAPLEPLTTAVTFLVVLWLPVREPPCRGPQWSCILPAVPHWWQPPDVQGAWTPLPGIVEILRADQVFPAPPVVTAATWGPV